MAPFFRRRSGQVAPRTRSPAGASVTPRSARSRRCGCASWLCLCPHADTPPIDPGPTAKGSPSVLGSVRLAAMSSPTASGGYVAGRPERGARPARPAPGPRTASPTGAPSAADTPSSASMLRRAPAVRRPASTMRARSTTRTGAVRERTKRLIARSSSAVNSRRRNNCGTGHLLAVTPYRTPTYRMDH